MNPWDLLFAILGWVFLALAILGAAILVFAFIVGIVRGVRQWFPKLARSGTRGTKKPASFETYSSEAKVVAADLYKDEIIMSQELVQAFQHGARWGWDFTHKK